MPHERTIYRWHHRLGSSLIVSPVFALERLGLSHVHAFVSAPRSGWEDLPYAVERVWVTPDCTTRLLYLHCVVPSAQEAVALERLRAVGECEVFTSGTGWQRLLPGREWTMPSIARCRGQGVERLLRDVPLVVPAIFEGWRETLSLDKTWQRIKERLGQHVRSYVPRQRYYATNGKRHVRAAYHALSHEGLFVQYAVHYHPRSADGVEAFVQCDHDVAAAFVERVRDEATLLAMHPGTDRVLFRVAGSARLLPLLLDAGASRCYWVHHRATDECPARVRFAYEKLFDPRTGSWVLPEANQ